MTLWTDERSQTAAELWSSRQYSASELAQKFGVTRNAFLGRMNRMNVRGGIAIEHQEEYKKKAAIDRKPKPKPIYISMPVLRSEPIEVTPRMVSLIDLEFNHCRWPLPGDDGETVFCGADRTAHSSYCEGHHALAYRPSSNRRPGERDDVCNEGAVRKTSGPLNLVNT